MAQLTQSCQLYKNQTLQHWKKLYRTSLDPSRTAPSPPFPASSPDSALTVRLENRSTSPASAAQESASALSLPRRLTKIWIKAMLFSTQVQPSQAPQIRTHETGKRR
ncbi:hypothetical protein WMY93_010157 [Mugilogobius chulae]|uniref:Uncharacterized protein n=1 Tax=Mugilogobius chulae TaxID=88201 RepID=A0AAW0PIZ8_9GOBI